MNTLFPSGPVFPGGFNYYPDFISIDEESLLMEACRNTTLQPMIFQGYTALRKVKSFGFDYSFDSRSISRGENIPSSYHFLIDKVADFTGIARERWAELLVTEYPPGSVINWHRDAPPFDVIAGVSLLSDAVFRLRPHEKEKQNRKSLISFPVLRRSLYVMRGESRTNWQHSIQPVKHTRYSITLRTLL
jgi:alkylated DNA repair dioxygenase AlkB